MSIVLGIDLSLTCTGLAVIENGKLVETGTIKSSGKKGDGLPERDVRIADIRNQVRGKVDRTGATFAVIEAPSFGSVHGSQHDRSGLWWQVVHMLYQRGLEVAQVTPMQRAKYGCGAGNGAKDRVHKAVEDTYGVTLKTNDEADALILAAMGSRAKGFPVEDFLTDAQLSAMEKVVWP